MGELGFGEFFNGAYLSGKAEILIYNELEQSRSVADATEQVSWVTKGAADMFMNILEYYDQNGSLLVWTKLFPMSSPVPLPLDIILK